MISIISLNQSEQKCSVSHLCNACLDHQQRSGMNLFANAQNPVINDRLQQLCKSFSFGCGYDLAIIVHRLVARTILSISLPILAKCRRSLYPKPNSSPFFTGRKDVLDELGKMFANRTTPTSRCSCLLWGLGGIGKTQICLKFIEEMSNP